ncbi:hypothetical protein [Neobacillus sp. SuZ13]|uniref:hypothetical protein n=1 Tax=Neobacillus sp. SuZ13 TaxID=3047875 RepID=UPI0024BF506B|nr:hypothetical protein [Neobacillus sp. SuZ13]WHY69188.1 hypothetical protein QNH17_11355 [Neobacillus sp. SuZ13]
MKFKLLLLSLGILMSVPGMAIAAPSTPDTSNGVQREKAPCDCEENGHRNMMHKDWQAKMEERQKMLFSWVDQFTPEKKAEWTAVLAEKKTLRNQWMSPENAAKREQWKKEKMAKIVELKKQLDAGKISKEEFFKQAHGTKEMSHWKTFHELKMAVEKKDNKQAALLLNQLLEQSKQHNQKIKELLKK